MLSALGTVGEICFNFERTILMHILCNNLWGPLKKHPSLARLEIYTTQFNFPLHFSYKQYKNVFMVFKWYLYKFKNKLFISVPRT